MNYSLLDFAEHKRMLRKRNARATFSKSAMGGVILSLFHLEKFIPNWLFISLKKITCALTIK